MYTVGCVFFFNQDIFKYWRIDSGKPEEKINQHKEDGTNQQILLQAPLYI